jgi:hypothetical protein
MSITDMNAAASSFFATPEEEAAFLAASRDVSLGFAGVRPRLSTAFVAACIRKSLIRARETSRCEKLRTNHSSMSTEILST